MLDLVQLLLAEVMTAETEMGWVKREVEVETEMGWVMGMPGVTAPEWQ